MRTEQGVPVRLSDYRVPDWLVKTVELDVVLDPTNRANKGPGSFIMIYEGSNRCIGLSGGDNILAGNSFYSTIAIATSNDFGHNWPSYRYMLDPNGFPLDPLPSQNPSKGPEAPSGATGKSVCIGNDCTTPPWPPRPFPCNPLNL